MQQRPSSISVGPSTPLAQRVGITGPKPVDVSVENTQNSNVKSQKHASILVTNKP